MDKFGFFNSVGGDRKYDADDISNFFYNLISDGVLVTPASNLKVSAFRDMQVKVGAGYAMIKAKYFKADADNVLTLDAADPANARIDRVVLTLNYAARNITLNVKKGTPAQSPTAPTLSRTEGVIWEISLADIAVAAGTTAITAADITDTRPDSTLCGYITGLIDQIDTTELFSQFTAAFSTWFANLTETLTVSVSVQMRRGIYTTATADEVVIPITVSGYDPTTDTLAVYINGLRLIPGVDYTEGATTITLANAISETGTKVFFEALVDAASSIISTVQADALAQSAGVPILGSISPAGDIIQINDMEQGSISSSGNTSSTTKIRSAGYYNIPNGKTGIQIYGVSNVSSKELQFDVLTYDDNDTLIDDFYWYAMGLSVGFSAGATKFRIVLRFSDSSDITPNDASNVKAALI